MSALDVVLINAGFAIVALSLFAYLISRCVNAIVHWVLP